MVEEKERNGPNMALGLVLSGIIGRNGDLRGRSRFQRAHICSILHTYSFSGCKFINLEISQVEIWMSYCYNCGSLEKTLSEF
jgi:hypothetical protein